MSASCTNSRMRPRLTLAKRRGGRLAAAGVANALQERSADAPSCDGGDNFPGVPLRAAEFSHPASIGHDALGGSSDRPDRRTADLCHTSLNQAGIRRRRLSVEVWSKKSVQRRDLRRQARARCVSRRRVRSLSRRRQYCRDFGIHQVQVAQRRSRCLRELRTDVGLRLGRVRCGSRVARCLRRGACHQNESRQCQSASLHGFTPPCAVDYSSISDSLPAK